MDDLAWWEAMAPELAKVMDGSEFPLSGRVGQLDGRDLRRRRVSGPVLRVRARPRHRRDRGLPGRGADSRHAKCQGDVELARQRRAREARSSAEEWNADGPIPMRASWSSRSAEMTDADVVRRFRGESGEAVVEPILLARIDRHIRERLQLGEVSVGGRGDDEHAVRVEDARELRSRPRTERAEHDPHDRSRIGSGRVTSAPTAAIRGWMRAATWRAAVETPDDPGLRQLIAADPLEAPLAGLELEQLAQHDRDARHPPGSGLRHDLDAAVARRDGRTDDDARPARRRSRARAGGAGRPRARPRPGGARRGRCRSRARSAASTPTASQAASRWPRQSGHPAIQLSSASRARSTAARVGERMRGGQGDDDRFREQRHRVDGGLGLAVRVGAVARVGEGDRDVQQAVAQHPERLRRLGLEVVDRETGLQRPDAAEQSRDDRRGRGGERRDPHGAGAQARRARRARPTRHRARTRC